jgi:hypothetical protein
MSISVSKQSLQNAIRNLSNFYEISVISFRIEILRHLNALSTPFYTPNVVHADFRVETIPPNRKTQYFKFRRNLCHFVPDSDTTEFKRPFHSILRADRIACRFQCWNSPCKSQNAIFQISTKSLSFRYWLRYYGIWTLFALHSTRRTNCMSISASKHSLQIAKRNLSNFDENSVISFRLQILRAYKSSLHSILHAECGACRLERRNKRCKSQTAIIQISTKSLSFRSGLRYYGI